MGPKCLRTPCRIGSSASQHVARLVAWIPTISVVWWSTASSTAAWPSSSVIVRSEEHTSELQSREKLVCRLLLEKKKTNNSTHIYVATYDNYTSFSTRLMESPAS